MAGRMLLERIQQHPSPRIRCFDPEMSLSCRLGFPAHSRIPMENQFLIEEFHLTFFVSKKSMRDAEIERAVRHVRRDSFRRRLERELRAFVRESPPLSNVRIEVSR
jgi:hypothetical protein